MKNFYKKTFLILVIISISTSKLNNRPADKKLLMTQITPKSIPSLEKDKNIFKWFRTFSEVIHLLTQKHYNKNLDIPGMIKYGLKASLQRMIDPHTTFFSEKDYGDVMKSTSGKFSGIGVSIMNKAPEDEALIIIDVIQGGPSDKAGLQPGDKIISVDKDIVKGLSSDEVINKLKGKVGTNVNLKIVRKKNPMEFTIKREVIKDQNLLCYEFKKQNIYYISLKMFAENTPKQMGNILKKANKNKCNGIIIDLRKNPGGVLDSAVDMSGLFIEKDSLVVSTKDQNLNIVNTYKTKNDPVLKKNIPIFLLVDNFTASASEIFAGCLRHYSEKGQKGLLAFIVGNDTFGKGSVQEVIPISNGCALKMTTMTYFIPNDVPIQAEGLKPDFLVNNKTLSKKEAKWVNDLYGKESALKNHIPSNLKKPKEKEEVKSIENESKEEIAKHWEERYQKAIGDDSQIKACINMINILNIEKEKNSNLFKNRNKALSFLKQNYMTDEKVELSRIR